RVEELPDGFRVSASTEKSKIAAAEDVTRGLYGVEWLPEIRRTEHGQDQIVRFLRDIAGIEGEWSAASIVDSEIQKIREQVGSARVICAL
ncbi:GMP synthase (glutamine-hydrolyzing), partial [Streptococcus agalactiae]|nr:GMP synthase (glutamine-hydrolyzing) [Streptococcus agalactiae]